MDFYWVNIGLSYDEVIKHSFLWAPSHGERPVDANDYSKGLHIRRYDYWDNVGMVKAGDIIFGNMNRSIKFIAVATQDAFPAPRPKNRAFSQWSTHGMKVKIDIFMLPSPLSVEGYIHDAFQTRYNFFSKPTVFKSNGHIFQGYMAKIPDAAGIDLLSLTEEIEAPVVEKSNAQSSAGGMKRRPVGATERQALRASRIGQGYFRQELLKIWKSCPVTGVKNHDLLIASHMKPWAKSTDNERLDPFNGFIFAPHIDRLFDKGLIGFSDTGNILISSQVSQFDLRALNISPSISIPIRTENKPYLNAHREIFKI